MLRRDAAAVIGKTQLDLLIFHKAANDNPPVLFTIGRLNRIFNQRKKDLLKLPFV